MTNEIGTDFTDMVMKTWAEAMQCADGDREGTASVLATALAFAASDGLLNIEEVISRVRDDFETANSAKRSMST